MLGIKEIKRNDLKKNKKLKSKDFPGGPVVKNRPSNAIGHRFDPWLGN